MLWTAHAAAQTPTYAQHPLPAALLHSQPQAIPSLTSHRLRKLEKLVRMQIAWRCDEREAQQHQGEPRVWRYVSLVTIQCVRIRGGPGGLVLGDAMRISVMQRPHL